MCLQLVSRVAYHIAVLQRRQRETTASVLSHPIPLSYKRALAPSFPPLPSTYTSGSAASSSTLSTADPTATDNDDPHVKACMQNLIASYLNYRGYSDTARSFRKQREVERKQWRDVVAESSTSYASSTTPATGDATSTGISGSSTPAKKKGKKKAEGGSKKLLKSALRTTLTDNDTSQAGTGEAQMRAEAGGDEDEDMQSASDLDKSLSRSTPSGLRDDYMTTDVKATSANLDDLEADEAELEDTLHRQDICSALRKGRIDYAMRQIEDHYPGVILPSSKENLEAMLNGRSSTDDEEKKRKRADLLFKLRCRKFVELVLASSAEAEEEEADVEMDAEPEDEDEQVASQLISSAGAAAESATSAHKGKGKANTIEDVGPSNVTFDQVLAYGAQLNSLYPPTSPNTSAQVLSHLKLLFSLVAYANPADLNSHGNKAIYELTRQEERDKLAEQVNKAMLESKGQPGMPHLELIYKQAHAVRNVLGDVFGDGRAALLGSVVDV